MRKAVLPVLAISLLLGWFGYTSSAFACSCVSATPAENFVNATTVFVGTVKNISKDGWKRLVDFEVINAQKGITDKAVTVSTGLGDGDCGVDFEEGKIYTVYAYDDGGQLGTGICSGTVLVNGIQDNVDVPAIGPEKKTSNFVLTVADIAISIGSGLLIGYFIERKSKTSK